MAHKNLLFLNYIFRKLSAHRCVQLSDEILTTDLKKRLYHFHYLFLFHNFVVYLLLHNILKIKHIHFKLATPFCLF